MLKVKGRAYVKETGEGLPGLHVKAVDKDLFFDDVVGTAITGTDGRYEITYDKKDFSELFEQAPDLYVVARDAANERILYSSEDSVRADASADETIDIAIPQARLASQAGDPYGPGSGKVQIRFSAAEALPADAKVFFSEHRAKNRKQHVVTVAAGKEASVDLPTGEYTMQIHARGFETVRGLAEVDAKRPFVFDAKLKPRTKKTLTLEERVAPYGIDLKRTPLTDLDVPRETTRVLDYRNDRENPAFRMLQSDSIAQIKKWIGSDDTRFGHNRPVYGKLPDKKHLARLGDRDLDVRKLTPEETKAVMSIAHEYVYGNATSVSQYEPALRAAIQATWKEAVTKIPMFIYKVVTINAGATLEISSVFWCDELRIHKTGKLKPVGSVTITIGTYTEFQ